MIHSLSRKEISRVKSTTHVKTTTNTPTSFACSRQVEPKCGLYPKNVLNSGPTQEVFIVKLSLPLHSITNYLNVSVVFNSLVLSTKSIENISKRHSPKQKYENSKWKNGSRLIAYTYEHNSKETFIFWVLMKRSSLAHRTNGGRGIPCFCWSLRFCSYRVAVVYFI